MLANPPGIDSGPLHRWYRAHQRDLPFRKTRAVYPIWVSEVMLQQTRVAAMLPKFLAFTARFPDLAALAAADEADVLAAWQGLGYYSRARNLRKGAQYVLREHGGEFPRDLAAALKVPGVGPYTAAAILSIALEQPTAVLDGNVKRVLDRLLGLTWRANSETNASTHSQTGFTVTIREAEYKHCADHLMQSRGNTPPGDHNQAMMELGAMICVPGRPDCRNCPLRTQCAMYALDPGGALAAMIPPKRKIAETVDLELETFLMYNKTGTKILIAREASSRFFRSLWFFPYRFRGAVYFDPAATPGLSGALAGELFGEVKKFKKHFRHSITHHRITGRVSRLRARAGEREILKAVQTKGAEATWRWLPVNAMHEVVVSSVARKIESIVNSAASV